MRELLLPEELFTAPVKVAAGVFGAGDPDLPELREGDCPPDASSSAKRRREFCAGRTLARRALAQLGVGEVSLPPDPEGIPLFPAGICGSLSHTGREKTWAAAVVSREARSLGLDLELRRPIRPALARRILTGAEEDALSQQLRTELSGPARPALDPAATERPAGNPAEQQQGIGDARELGSLAAVIAFSAKEAFYKAVYPVCGQFLGFLDVELRPRGAGELEIVCTDAAAASGKEQGTEPVPSLTVRYRFDTKLVVSATTWR